MIEQPAVITDKGDILLHNQEGALLPIFFEDDQGNPRVMTGLTVAFITSNGARVVLAPGVATNQLNLALTAGMFSAFLGKSVPFIVRDESMTETPVLWRGQVIVQGW